MLVAIGIAALVGALIIVGIVGCFVPGIPGPPLAFVGLIAVSFASGWTAYQPLTLVVLGLAAVAMLVLDNILPLVSARKAGAGKAGIWGSIIGMLLGILFLPPFGMIIGAFGGALLGEVLFHKENKKPFLAALAILGGTILASLLKFVVTIIIGVYGVIGAIKLF